MVYWLGVLITTNISWLWLAGASLGSSVERARQHKKCHRKQDERVKQLRVILHNLKWAGFLMLCKWLDLFLLPLNKFWLAFPLYYIIPEPKICINVVYVIPMHSPWPQGPLRDVFFYLIKSAVFGVLERSRKRPCWPQVCPLMRLRVLWRPP